MQTELRNFASQIILKKCNNKIYIFFKPKGPSKSRSMQTQRTNISSQNILGIVQIFFRVLDIGSTPKNTKQQPYTNINKTYSGKRCPLEVNN